MRVVRSLKMKSGKAGPSQPSLTNWLSEPRTLSEMGVFLEDMMFDFLECHPTMRSIVRIQAHANTSQPVIRTAAGESLEDMVRYEWGKFFLSRLSA